MSVGVYTDPVMYTVVVSFNRTACVLAVRSPAIRITQTLRKIKYNGRGI